MKKEMDPQIKDLHCGLVLLLMRLKIHRQGSTLGEKPGDVGRSEGVLLVQPLDLLPVPLQTTSHAFLRAPNTTSIGTYLGNQGKNPRKPFTLFSTQIGVGHQKPKKGTMEAWSWQAKGNPAIFYSA